jgi:hypothetical protein
MKKKEVKKVTKVKVEEKSEPKKEEVVITINQFGQI